MSCRKAPPEFRFASSTLRNFVPSGAAHEAAAGHALSEPFDNCTAADLKSTAPTGKAIGNSQSDPQSQQDNWHNRHMGRYYSTFLRACPAGGRSRWHPWMTIQDPVCRSSSARHVLGHFVSKCGHLDIWGDGRATVKREDGHWPSRPQRLFSSRWGHIFRRRCRGSLVSFSCFSVRSTSTLFPNIQFPEGYSELVSLFFMFGLL